jgi:hypothetical protein
VVKNLLALLFGVGVGVSSTFLHNSYQPFGLFVALIATSLGAYLVREMYLSRLSNLSFAIGWVFVIVRGSTLGNGGELLIESNGYGNLLVIIGVVILLLSITRSKKLK